jgi:hypothetical protein
LVLPLKLLRFSQLLLVALGALSHKLLPSLLLLLELLFQIHSHQWPLLFKTNMPIQLLVT